MEVIISVASAINVVPPCPIHAACPTGTGHSFNVLVALYTYVTRGLVVVTINLCVPCHV